LATDASAAASLPGLPCSILSVNWLAVTSTGVVAGSLPTCAVAVLVAAAVLADAVALVGGGELGIVIEVAIEVAVDAEFAMAAGPGAIALDGEAMDIVGVGGGVPVPPLELLMSSQPPAIPNTASQHHRFRTGAPFLVGTTVDDAHISPVVDGRRSCASHAFGLSLLRHPVAARAALNRRGLLTRGRIVTDDFLPTL
jgi:hypothetical protein